MSKKRNPAQISMTDEIIVDLFAGGGGASTGIEIATQRVVNIAVNHNKSAILLHQTNHPWTEHYQEDVWKVDQKNETIDFVKYYQYQGRECKYSIGYFWWDSKEPRWELHFCGDRFKEILEGDVTAIFKMLKAAYDTLDEWKARCRADDD